VADVVPAQQRPVGADREAAPERPGALVAVADVLPVAEPALAWAAVEASRWHSPLRLVDDTSPLGVFSASLGAGLVVVGERALLGWPGAPGLVAARRVAAVGGGAVVAVPGALRHDRPPVVVVGVSGGVSSWAAFAWAGQEAARLGCALRVVHAWQGVDDADVRAVAGGGPPRRTGAGARGGLLPAGLVVSTAVVAADPARALLDASRSAALVVLGLRVGSTTRGSVCEAVLDAAEVPVVLVPSEAGGG